MTAMKVSEFDLTNEKTKEDKGALRMGTPPASEVLGQIRNVQRSTTRGTELEA